MRLRTTPQSFLPADTTTKKTLVTAGTNGSKIAALIVTSTDTAARILQLWLTRSAVSYLIGSVEITIASGSDGTTPSVNLLNTTAIPGLPIDSDGQPYLFIAGADTLQASVTVTVTSAKEIDVISVFGNF
jgi:hypothetical protein